mmetsp:Transcript_22246/g.37703  ORF Transcript_22246/g.37703 Transcript_22246/m.37703 type:complete len:500 (-) Transcript_22246:235-1734(-)
MSRRSFVDEVDDNKVRLSLDSTGSDRKLQRRLGFWDGTCILITIIIGSGIFSSPGETLDRSGSPMGALIAWTISGVLVITAALCYAELGAMMPSSGGDYEYLLTVYGKPTAFSFAWFYFWIAKTGGQAIISTVFGNYIIKLYSGLRDTDDDGDDDGSEGQPYVAKAFAMGLIVLMTVLNMLGVKESSFVVNSLTALKLALVVVLCGSGIYYVSKTTDTASENLSPSNSGDGTDLIGIGSAMIPCLWAYDGWSNISYLAEEMIDFETRLPKAIVGGVSCVMVCYLLANVSYLTVLSVDKFEDSDAIAVDFGSKIGGHDVTLAGIFAAGVALSTAGAAHGSIMTGGRAFFSVARQRMAPAQMAKLNSRGAPYIALLAQSTWTLVLLALPGSSFASLLDYSGSASWIFYALVGSIVVRLRITQPEMDRPFKVPLYPLPPFLLCSLSLFLIVSSLLQSPMYTCLGLGLVALSYPVWLIKCRFWGDGDDERSDVEVGATEPLLS